MDCSTIMLAQEIGKIVISIVGIIATAVVAVVEFKKL